tara:strand:- start:270 stop:680 length:411 start_codon:yes stop_codon:yes gene_type:complete
MQYFLGMEPCELCVIQRYPYYIILLLCSLSQYLYIKKITSYVLKILYAVGFFSACGLIIAIYHVGIENFLWKNIYTCSDQLSGNNISVANLLDGINEIATSCSEPIELMGISIATYNIISNLFMILLIIYGIYKTE